MATIVMNGNDCFKNGNDRLQEGKLPRRVASHDMWSQCDLAMHFDWITVCFGRESKQSPDLETVLHW